MLKFIFIQIWLFFFDTVFNCFIDDLAIAAGVLLFIILLIIIIAVTASGGAIVASPLKNGRYVDAVTSCGYVEG